MDYNDFMNAVNTGKNRYRKFLFPALIVCIGLILFVRCRCGFDWSDEAYYTTLPYRLAQGDQLFSRMWELHQLSVIPLLPLAKLYLFINGGSTDGMILFFRSAFTVFETAVALGCFFLLKKRYSPFTAFLAAALLQCSTHFALSNFSYDSMPPLFLVLSVFLLIDGGQRIKTRNAFALLSGVFYALAVQCYPQLALSVPVYAAYWIFTARAEQKAGAPARRALFFMLGVGLVIALFCAFLAVNSSFGALIENIPNLLNDPSHNDANYVRRILNYFHTLIVVFGPVFYLAVYLPLLALAIQLLRKALWPHAARTLFLSCLALGVLSVLRLLCYDIEGPTKSNFLAMALTPLAPALFIIDNRRKSPMMLLYALGIAFSLSAQLFSNMGIHASSFPLILSSVATLLYAAESPLLAKEASDNSASAKRSHALFAAMGVFLLACVFFFRIAAMHRDEPLGLLDTKLSSGPARGLITTAESAREYEEIVHAIQSSAPAKGNLLVTSMLPFGYLCTDLLPAAQSVWHSPYSDRLAYYYSLHPDRLPDMIVTVPENVGYSYGDGGAAALLSYLKKTYARTYSVAVENAYCTVYLCN